MFQIFDSPCGLQVGEVKKDSECGGPNPQLWQLSADRTTAAGWRAVRLYDVLQKMSVFTQDTLLL